MFARSDLSIGSFRKGGDKMLISIAAGVISNVIFAILIELKRKKK
jgi:hypothetical protein